MNTMKKYNLIILLLLSQFSGAVFAVCIEGNCGDGYGTYIFSNGDEYVGEWKDDTQHGQGTYTWGVDSEFAGDQYVGEYKDDKQHGQGTYTWADGTTQTGIWEDDEYIGTVAEVEK